MIPFADVSLGSFPLLLSCFSLSFLADRRCSSDCSRWRKPSDPSKPDGGIIYSHRKIPSGTEKNVFSTSCCASFSISRPCNIRWILVAEQVFDFQYFWFYDSVLCSLLYYGLLDVIFFCGVLWRESFLHRFKHITSKTLICHENLQKRIGNHLRIRL